MGKTKHSVRIIILLFLLFMGMIVLLLYGKISGKFFGDKKTAEEMVREQMTQIETEKGQEMTNASEDSQEAEKDPEEGKNISQKETYTSPIDFEALREQNPDICAWLRIPDTNISYPILKNQESGEFYLDHDSMKEASKAGALFLDDYNKSILEDVALVVYGHHMKSGEFFGNLQSYYEEENSFFEHQYMTLYLPQEERDYKVFAAVPYEMIHLLYNYDFSDIMDFYVFMDRILEVRSLSAQQVEEDFPEYGEKLLILSTCLQGDSEKRYLVLAKECEK